MDIPCHTIRKPKMSQHVSPARPVTFEPLGASEKPHCAPDITTWSQELRHQFTLLDTASVTGSKSSSTKRVAARHRATVDMVMNVKRTIPDAAIKVWASQRTMYGICIMPLFHLCTEQPVCRCSEEHPNSSSLV